MKKLFLYTYFLLAFVNTFAQTHEIGLTGGTTNFIGDIGRAYYLYPTDFSGGIIYKYNANTRIALRAGYTKINISGNDLNSDNIFRKKRNMSFENKLREFSFGVDFNFFEFNVRDYKAYYTPYITAQVAMFQHKTPTGIVENNERLFEKKYSLAIPVGIGFKGKLTDNIVFSLESAIRFTFNDDLDYTTNKIKEFNFGGYGNDYYVFTGITIAYTFGNPLCFFNIDN